MINEDESEMTLMLEMTIFEDFSISIFKGAREFRFILSDGEI